MTELQPILIKGFGFVFLVLVVTGLLRRVQALTRAKAPLEPPFDYEHSKAEVLARLRSFQVPDQNILIIGDQKVTCGQMIQEVSEDTAIGREMVRCHFRIRNNLPG